MTIKRINNQADLVALARELGLRPDWHEPDERGVTALVSGHTFDNAGFWGVRAYDSDMPSVHLETWVTLMQRHEGAAEAVPVAEVNLATLFAWACGYRDK